MKTDCEIINTKQLRTDLPRVMRRVGEGARFLVLHRSRPAFELGPPGWDAVVLPPLKEDPVLSTGAIGASKDGETAAGHDRLLYGP